MSPINSPAAPPGTQAPAPEHDILVVDDEESFRMLLKVYLESAGYRVALAADGNAAITVLERSAVRLLITDIFMPEADGLELLQSLHRRWPDVPVIAMSGSSAFDVALFQRIARVFGANQTLTKPFGLAELVRAVTAEIGLPRCDAAQA